MEKMMLIGETLNRHYYLVANDLSVADYFVVSVHKITGQQKRVKVETSPSGYDYITLKNNEKAYIHRRIANGADDVKTDKSKIVHHIDGDSQNNSPSNLVPMTRQQHYYAHLRDDKKRKLPHGTQRKDKHYIRLDFSYSGEKIRSNPVKADKNMLSVLGRLYDAFIGISVNKRFYMPLDEDTTYLLTNNTSNKLIIPTALEQVFYELYSPKGT